MEVEGRIQFKFVISFLLSQVAEEAEVEPAVEEEVAVVVDSAAVVVVAALVAVGEVRVVILFLAVM